MDSVSFTPPARRSMTDFELDSFLNRPHSDESGLLEAMQLLEMQTALRAEDDAAIAAWRDQMRAINSPESIAALDAQAGVSETPVNLAPAAPEPPKSLFEELAAAAGVANPPVELIVEPEPMVEVLPPLPSEPELPQAQLPFANLELNPTAGNPAQAELASSESIEVAESELAADESPADKNLASLDILQTEPEEPNSQLARQLIFPLVPVAIAQPAISVTSDAGVSAEQAASELEENSEHSETKGFDELLGIAPQPSAAFLDDAKTAVSTAHSSSSNQRASSLFFNWLPIVGSVVPVIIAVYLYSLGLSFSESVLALAISLFAAFVTTTTGAIAGKRSGLQTFIVSRATFGVYGARIPAALFAVLKLAAASLMVLLLVIASNKAQSGWSVEGVTATRWAVGPVSVALWQVIIGASVVVVAAISFIKLRYVKFLNLVVGLAASVAVVAALAMTLVGSNPDVTLYNIESWPVTLGASAVAFAAFGTVWSSSGADFAFSLDKSIRGARVIGWSFLSLFIVPLAMSVATLLVMQNSPISFELLGFASVLPELLRPYGFGLLGAVILLLAAVELRSTREALMAVHTWFGSNLARTLLALAFVCLSLAGWHFYSTQGILYNMRDYALILSVPVAAWLGTFTADTVLRRIAFHEVSLTRSYGFYGNYNWVNLTGFSVATALGLGFMTSSLQEFEWAGYLSRHSVNPAFWSDANLGLALAFAFGVLMPLVFGIPRIRRQESEVLAIESRRYELRDVMVITDSISLADEVSND